MLNKLYSRPLPTLQIQVGEQPLNFLTIADFEFALAGRTAVPTAKIQRLLQYSMQELLAEAHTIKEVDQCFIEILSRSIEDEEIINHALLGLDPLIFSQDHGWREIISSLNERGKEYDAYRRVALVKYMQYLAARQDIIKHLYAEKKRFQTNNGDKSAKSESLKDTFILEGMLTASALSESNGEFGRLPKCEALRVQLNEGQEMEVLLSRHKYRLGNHGGFKFADDEGRQHNLAPSQRTIVGRDAASDIVLDPAWRDISRKHLMIEAIDGTTLYLTDLSSHGTYVNNAYL